jgi:mono/diheme cytochrome c family protein
MKKAFALLTVMALAALFTAGLTAGDEAACADEGQTLYNKKCAICHSKSGKAKKSAKDSGDFNDPEWQAAASLDQIIKDIAEGKGKMKAFGKKFTSEQIGMIAAYVQTLGPATSDEPAAE